MPALALLRTPDTVPLTRREYERLVEEGLLDDQPVELLDGRKVGRMAESPAHAAVMETIAEQMTPAASTAGLQLRRSHPVALSELDEPEPDIALVRGRTDHYRHAHPAASDVVLLVEVAGTSLARDMGEKAARYAAAGILEYGVVDLDARRTTVHRRPDVAGARYLEITTSPFEASVRFEGLDVAVRLGEC